MDKRSRAYRIYKVGANAIGREPEDDDGTGVLSGLKAIAVMLDEATRKPTRKKHEPDTLVSPRRAFEILRSSGAIDCDPVDRRWFGRLGKELEALKLTEADVNQIADYLSEGGWVGARPDMGKVISYLSALATRAKSQPAPKGRELRYK
jgi:hypothetical protein